MSGYGLKEAHAGLALAAEGKTWRDDAFLHQLSTNGSLMLARNHDPLWLDAVCQALGQPDGSTWERLRSLLRTLPAHRARGALWHASQLWWAARQHLHIRTLMTVAGQGAAVEYIEQTRGAQNKLATSSQQLDALTWCLEAQAEDGERIAIANRPPRRALARG